MPKTPRMPDAPIVRCLMLQRRRSRVPWIYLLYHRKRRAPGTGDEPPG